MMHWLIDSNGISTRPGQFYTKRLGSSVSSMLIFIFVVFFSHGIFFLNRSISPIDGTLIGTNTPQQSEPGSNSPNWVFHTP